VIVRVVVRSRYDKPFSLYDRSALQPSSLVAVGSLIWV